LGGTRTRNDPGGGVSTCFLFNFCKKSGICAVKKELFEILLPVITAPTGGHQQFWLESCGSSLLLKKNIYNLNSAKTISKIKALVKCRNCNLQQKKRKI
jgi:hypothetical protein